MYKVLLITKSVICALEFYNRFTKSFCSSTVMLRNVEIGDSELQLNLKAIMELFGCHCFDIYRKFTVHWYIKELNQVLGLSIV